MYSLQKHSCIALRKIFYFVLGACYQQAKLFRRRLSAEGAKPESNKRWKTGSGHAMHAITSSDFDEGFGDMNEHNPAAITGSTQTGLLPVL